MSQTLPDTTTQPAEPATRTIKARYLAAGMTVVYDDGTRDLITGTIRDGDDVTATMADGATATYYVEEGVTVTGDSAPVQPAEPDYWLALADDIRKAADRAATLVGQPKPPYVGLGINVADPGNKDAAAADRVDVIAAAFGLTAETRRSTGGYYERSARAQIGQLNLSFYGYVPDPEQSEVERLRAENAELLARLAEGGAR
ncbi:hypothetical protein MCAG_03866 [Micromonospora sp. ATCC 39149]|uniref:hypothetical protein n=1 Tax=Micromonospora sp. (strain ATCC 39149 / NRRL 15099 / SCC 1413) TaxID=219305 RepID=UPI0001A5059B|nr:hypothetical protein [Micromonospora sp. ATCC 39149]EEP73539.1 hypothetical protein MCAG_03866 [Micromonospora sp. ATCC 39149]